MKGDLLTQLARHGQEHLLQFWDELDEAQRAALAGDIGSINFELIGRLARSRDSGENWAALARRARPPQAIRLGDAHPPFPAEKARKRGEAALAAGRVGAVLVAGGQGTRLGFDHPKGMYPIGPVSGCTLFQILLEKLLAVGRRYGTRVPLYLMTSPATYEETIGFLAEHNRFGLEADDVRVFCQGTMPAVDAANGHLLLAEKGRVSLSPDGHGGLLRSLETGGLLKEIRCRGLDQLFYFQVDNPLVKLCDPTFIGYHLLFQSEMSTQVVAKQFPLEKVGNLVEVDGRTRIIEYSDLPVDDAQRRNADGSLALWAGNTAVHVFDVAFLERVAAEQDSLPFHVALKKVPYVDAAGKCVEPTEPNAVKFERFIFDLLPAARRTVAVEVDAATTFAPVKNAPGAERDSPEAVQARMIELHTAWLKQAGLHVAAGTAVEISPLCALEPDDLNDHVDAGRIDPARIIDSPRYFSSGSVS